MKTIIAFGTLVGSIGAAVLIACGGEAGNDASTNESASNAPSSSHSSSSPSAARGVENDELAVSGMAPRGASVDSPSVGTPGADASASPNYFSCQTNSDCVAVSYFENCCYNGLEIAVASSEAAAYEKATACAPAPSHVCPLFIIHDTQVPACESGRCTMVNPTDGGSTLPVGTPDAGGTTGTDDASTCDDATTPQTL